MFDKAKLVVGLWFLRDVLFNVTSGKQIKELLIEAPEDITQLIAKIFNDVVAMRRAVEGCISKIEDEEKKEKEVKKGQKEVKGNEEV